MPDPKKSSLRRSASHLLLPICFQDRSVLFELKHSGGSGHGSSGEAPVMAHTWDTRVLSALAGGPPVHHERLPRKRK